MEPLGKGTQRDLQALLHRRPAVASYEPAQGRQTRPELLNVDAYYRGLNLVVL